jgi:hypothetical protein
MGKLFPLSTNKAIEEKGDGWRGCGEIKIIFRPVPLLEFLVVVIIYF